MVPPVAIVVSPPDGGAASIRALEDACSSAVRGETRCAVVPPAGVPGETAAEVTVLWLDDARRSALVRVRVRAAPVVRERHMTFSPTDPDVERWRAIGFAIATLIEESNATSAPPPVSAAPAASAAPSGPPLFPSPSSSAPPPPAPAAAARQDGAATFGQASVRVLPPAPATRTFALGVVGKALSSVNGLLVVGPEARFAADVGDPYEATFAMGSTVGGGDRGRLASGLTWFSAGVRTTLWAPAPSRYWLRVEVLVEELRLDARDLALRDSADKWQPGGLVAVGVERRFGRVSLAAACELGVRSGTTTVFVEGVEVARLRALRPALELGGAFTFLPRAACRGT